MRNESIETLPATELGYLLCISFMSIRRKNGMENNTSQQQFPIFSAELSRMKKDASNRYRE